MSDKARDAQAADLEAIARAGVTALSRGDAASARRAFDAVAYAGRASPQLWLLLAQACAQLDDRPAAHVALDQLFTVDRSNLDGLVMKGDLLGRAGDDRAAVSWYEAALRTAPPPGTPLAEVTLAALRRAEAARDAAAERFSAHLTARLASAGVDAKVTSPRFAEALAILSGTATPYLQAPTSFFYPRLPHIPFFGRDQFPWLGALEAAVPAMRAEALAVLAGSEGKSPYVERPADRPSKEHSLLGDARWSAFHLWKDGVLVADNARRCPATIAALAGVPIPRIAGRSPMVLFSILQPGTHIPPHNGMLNTRLICHIPLIVPDNCVLRVGNEACPVLEGEAMIFDDSIEHEAWNRSDQPRVVLLFEVWRPELDAVERNSLTAMFEAIGTYGQAATVAPVP